MSLPRELVEQHELFDIAAGLDASREVRLKLITYTILIKSCKILTTRGKDKPIR